MAGSEEGSRPQTLLGIRSNLPVDLMALVSLTAGLWLITAVWMIFDLGHSLDNVHVTEGQIWFLALSGLIFIPIIIAGIAASWGVFLGIPTSLLMVNLVLRQYGRPYRWGVAALLTALIFVGIPMALNSFEEQRLSKIYQVNDTSEFRTTQGRAVELPQNRALPSTWVRPLHCSGRCLDLLTFGQARLVTISFSRSERPDEPGPFFQSFTLGRSRTGCDGEQFRNYCAKLSEAPLPPNRLILTLEDVAPLSSDAHKLVIRRMVVKDAGNPEIPLATMTQFVFNRYPVLLNIAWNGHGFYLPRNNPPILVEDSLDAAIYRKLLPKSLDGKYYPFH